MTTVLRWGNQEYTIRTEMNRKIGLIENRRIWWNERLVWDYDTAKKEIADSLVRDTLSRTDQIIALKNQINIEKLLE